MQCRRQTFLTSMIIPKVLDGIFRLRTLTIPVNNAKFISLHRFCMDGNQTMKTAGLFKGVKDSYNGIIVRSSMEPCTRQVMEEVLKGLISSHSVTTS